MPVAIVNEYKPPTRKLTEYMITVTILANSTSICTNTTKGIEDINNINPTTISSGKVS